jgi:hypothetical protein
MSSFSDITFAGEPETYWQESVLVQAFINQFRPELDATLPDLPQAGDVWLTADYSSWRTEAWFWPTPVSIYPGIGMEGGPNWNFFAGILTELGITNAAQMYALCAGWQTLHIGTVGNTATYDEGGYSTGLDRLGWAHRPDPLPYKFGFRPRFWNGYMHSDGPSSANYWPRTYPAGEETLATDSGYGRHINKMIYVPDQDWYSTEPRSISTLEPPILWGLNGKGHSLPLMARGEVRDAQVYEGVIFEKDVGFIDKSGPSYYSGTVIAYQSRLPYNTDELLSILADYASAIEAMAEIIPDADSELE